MSPLLLLVATTVAATIVVDQSGGGDALTIADGMALLADGDTLPLRAGTYYDEWSVTPVDNLTIMGEGSDITVWDGLDVEVSACGYGGPSRFRTSRFSTSLALGSCTTLRPAGIAHRLAS